MYLFVLVLNESENLEQVLYAIEKAGKTGATILESTGVGRTLFKSDFIHFPLIAGITKLQEKIRPNNRTIFSVLESQKQLENVKQAVLEITGDLSEPNKGIMFVVPVVEAEGLTKYE